jgi:hypothetical protein
MNKILLTLLLLSTLPLGAAPPNPADFPITVHVVYSRSPISGGEQRIDVQIDGQTVELTSNASGVLKLGDYPARISPKVNAPKNWSPYDLYKGYDFLMPDGKVRTYYVTAMGSPLMPVSSGNQ